MKRWGSNWVISTKCLLVLIALLCAISCARYDPLQESGAWDSGSSIDGDGSLCEGVDCSGRGTCEIKIENPVCICDAGYHAEELECVEDCTPNAGAICTDGVTYWIDSCGNLLELKEQCECGCNADSTGCQDPCGCVPDCSGKSCGPDGCEGTCPPSCEEDEICVSGTCEQASPEIVWVEIPGGTFMMGSNDPEADTYERPAHRVTVRTFEMTRAEVTLAQYRFCVDAGVCTDPDDRWDNYYCNWLYNGRENDPVNCVDWHQAVEFCAWAGGRLPTEAEWEYAARSGGRSITYPWGDNSPMECVHAHYAWCIMKTSSVCSHPSGHTAQRLCDMAGNVWEWVQDRYHGSYDCDANSGADNCGSRGLAPTDGSAWEGPGDMRRVLRGGSWTSTDPYYIRSS